MKKDAQYYKIFQNHLGSNSIESYLKSKGYEIELFAYSFETKISEETFEMFTKTATKRGELQSVDNLYLKVFKSEIIKSLKWTEHIFDKIFKKYLENN